ncbi:glycoside hydrolase family 3 protein [Microbacterium sp. M28]|uniref:glycoside hydrolase family 3 protein n=1 Tax=Microbacterium sp. M28 TaxID=2962064 RepID=UPI0021F492B7|nr:glycoside hydrolase family 3 N-terminal domain-containing protein [Microbacterium sp. M28]UYO96406.1 glycoside hydrolase family 3 protein [Microbacterium sp. M28]
MSDELTRLANSVLWPGFLGTEAPEWLLAELRDGLAGVVYFGQNMSERLPELSAALRAAAPDALIGIDEEGGSVTRLESATGSTLPGAAQLGRVDDVTASRATGAELARRARAAGVDVVLGPVADVNTDPRNPVIGVRAFGDDAQLVARHVAATVDGIQSGGAAACVKHFPGHGDTHLDSHHALPEITLDTSVIEDVHLEPFRAAIAAGVDTVMTAHIVVPAWGEKPATLNPLVLGKLRALGFDGVIITDALDMAAVRESVGLGGGAVQALAAGADLLCIGNPTNPGAAALPDQDERDFFTTREAIVAALRDGSLPRERVEQARDRILALSAKLRAATPDTGDAYDAAGIVRRALRVVGDRGASASALAVVDARRRSTLAVDSAAGYVAAALAGNGFRVRLDVERASDAERDAALEAATADAGRLVLLVDRPEVEPAQRALIERAAALDAEAIVVNVGLPVRGDLALPVIDASAASRISAEVVRDLLTR